VSFDFSGNSVKWEGGEGGGIKYVFLGLRRQLRCQAEGKNITKINGQSHKSDIGTENMKKKKKKKKINGKF
jgi:hypothetical protein